MNISCVCCGNQLPSTNRSSAMFSSLTGLPRLYLSASRRATHWPSTRPTGHRPQRYSLACRWHRSALPAKEQRVVLGVSYSLVTRLMNLTVPTRFCSRQLPSPPPTCTRIYQVPRGQPNPRSDAELDYRAAQRTSWRKDGREVEER